MEYNLQIVTMLVPVLHYFYYLCLFKLVASPSVLTPAALVTVLHMLVQMCATCPDLAVVLLKHSTL